jgi:alpha-methylacyl-CoA racemase
MAGPLAGMRVLEFAGAGPVPFAGMMLADQGAAVIRIDRPSGLPIEPRFDVLGRSKRSIVIDLKQPAGIEIVRRLAKTADAVLEGFRPGVMERLGLGPQPMLDEYPRLVFARMSGYGQVGPYVDVPGHDINYLALAGVLHGLGPEGHKPHPPMNMVADFGGGVMLAFGVACAWLQAQRTGRGQVVDGALVDAAALMMGATWGLIARGDWSPERGANLLDGGAHFYNVYETKDAQFVSVGSAEPHFYRELLRRVGADAPAFDRQMEREAWPELRARFAEIFKTRTLAEWCAELEATQTCFAPVLPPDRAAQHPHNRARNTFLTIDGTLQPAPTPRFPAGPPPRPTSAPDFGEHTETILKDLGYAGNEIAQLVETGVVAR